MPVCRADDNVVNDIIQFHCEWYKHVFVRIEHDEGSRQILSGCNVGSYTEAPMETKFLKIPLVRAVNFLCSVIMRFFSASGVLSSKYDNWEKDCR